MKLRVILILSINPRGKNSMRIDSINYQPNCKGKLMGKGVLLLKDSHWDVPEGLDARTCLEIPDNLLNKIREMVKEKPYDVFVSPSKSNKDFLNIDANDSFEKVQNGIQGRVKVNRNALEALPQAVQEAMDIFEESQANKFLSRYHYLWKE